MSSNNDRIRIEPYEDRGYFFHIRFDGEEKPTAIFVAEQDFEQLREMAADPETDPDRLRRELFSLIEHSGHGRDHELGDAGIETLQDRLNQSGTIASSGDDADHGSG